MKKPFAVGDRVRVYMAHAVRDGSVSALCDGSYFSVNCDNGDHPIVHPKQCRRLVKKKNQLLCYCAETTLRNCPQHSNPSASIRDVDLSELMKNCPGCTKSRIHHELEMCTDCRLQKSHDQNATDGKKVTMYAPVYRDTSSWMQYTLTPIKKEAETCQLICGQLPIGTVEFTVVLREGAK